MPPSPSLSARMMKRHVLDRDDDRDRPHDQRDDAVDGGYVGLDAGSSTNTVLHRVQRARADVAEDDAERAEGQRAHPRDPNSHWIASALEARSSVAPTV